MMFRTALCTWFAFPVYVWQGIATRRRVERMAPPAGVSTGFFGGPERGAGRDGPDGLPRDGGAHIRLLVIGDSSAAGVGVSRIEESLAPRLAEKLHALSGRTVAWRAAGFNSAVAGEIRDHVVPNLAREAFSHIVLHIGTNDAKNFHTARRFKKAFGGLLYALRAKWPEARIVWSPPVDLQRVPALPKALARILEGRAKIIRRTGARLCIERGAVAATSLPRVEPIGFSRDGFHASAEGYAYMASHLAGYVLGER